MTKKTISSMRPATLALGFLLGAIVFIATSLVLAWTGPTSAPPNGNVSAPINVGTTDQVKDAGLALNRLAVFGNAILSGASRYLNFGATSGSSGYGIRDNNGTMEFKNNNGAWQAIATTTSGSGTGAGGISAQIFTVSGTFTVPSGVTAVKVILIGGGGGAGGPMLCSGGGGAGGTATKWVTGLTPGANMSVVVGTGGGLGVNGGASSFAGVTANGGYAASGTSGGAGGSTSGADFGVTGGTGSNAFCAFGASSAAGGVSQGEYSNVLGYSYGHGGASDSNAGMQDGVVIIQW
ncbi:hypothetical protein HY418_03735 [Candidatus Kaiserbacteria bacterium]|nr:hypothetical protein [Candidatus Kaiserbacteria bacterium]